MVKWFNYHEVRMVTARRDNVESGVWIQIWITVKYYDDEVHRQGNEFIIDGQRPDIVQARLAKFLKSRHKMPVNQP